jgi:hypothetical protein
LKTVGRLLPLTCTVELPFTYPLPVTVNVKLGPPTPTVEGLIEVMVGTVWPWARPLAVEKSKARIAYRDQRLRLRWRK